MLFGILIFYVFWSNINFHNIISIQIIVKLLFYGIM